VVKTGLQDYRLGVPCLPVALPRSIRSRNLTTLREKLVKIGAKVEAHAEYVVVQLAEVAVPHLRSHLRGASLSRGCRSAPEAGHLGKIGLHTQQGG